jgi:hypothetical protein
MSGDWSAEQYQREKRNFIASRLLHRWVAVHAALIFTVTWLAGWFASWALMKLGLASMPLRYALAFAFAYLVFMGAVRLWADEMRRERGSGVDAGSSLDVPAADAEGCAIALAIGLVALLVAGLFALTGGLPLLLEVAFEVVFAGVVVRRAARMQVLGNWATALVRNTWIHALVMLLILVIVAAALQASAPGAASFAQAVQMLWRH